MKVLYIINSVSMAGATISFINMVKELLKYGVKPIIVIPNTCSLMEESAFLKHFDGLAIKVFKMPVVSLEFKKIHSLFSLRTNLYICKKFLLAKLRGLKSYESLKTIIVQEKPDVIHTNVGPIHVGFHLSQKYNIPHVWHLREYQDLDFDWKIQPTKRIFERMLSMSSVITITKDIFSHFNLDNNPWASVIYNGIFVSGSAFIPCICFQMFLPLHHNFKIQSYDSSRRTLREGMEFLLDLFKPSSQGATETISDGTAHQSPHNAKLVVRKRILSV